VPWVSLGMALSWSLYSLIRRAKKIPAIEGLTIELSFFLVPAVVWLAMFGFASAGPKASAVDLWWLVGLGIVTALPLLFFGAATTRINLATLGILQFVAPTAQFLLGVFFNGEPFDRWRAVAFVFIWLAVAIYALDGLRQGHRMRGNRAT
ncbi:MAG: EamA family transporter RarD, partial [Planctomycetota bacterium]